MPFRPEWYQKERDRPGGFMGMGDWSAFRIIATFSILFWAIEVLVAPILQQGRTPLFEFMALRAWWVNDYGEPVFNFLFPVQLFTYMLQHDTRGFSHLFFNLLYLFFFGRELEASMGRNAFLRFFVAGGVLGGLVQWIASLVAMDAVPVVGASGAVYATMALFVLRWPRRVVMLIFPPFPIPVVVIAVVRILGDISGVMEGGTGVAHFAHLGGALAGLIWWWRGDMLGRFTLRLRQAKVESKARKEEPDRREMDRILGKIQTDGLASLTKAERAYLERRSRELREQRR